MNFRIALCFAIGAIAAALIIVVSTITGQGLGQLFLAWAGGAP